MKKIFCVLFIISIYYASYAQTQPDSLSDTNRNEINYLEKRNRDLIQFQDKLTDTIYWSLGFSATFLILFLGVNIYFLRNKYNEDNQRFLKQIEDTLTIKSNELENKVKSIIDEIIESKLYKINDQLTSLESAIIDLSISNDRTEIELAKLNNESDKMILLYYFHLARKMKESKNILVEQEIAKIFSEMEKLIDKGITFVPSAYIDVTSFLDSLPPKFADIVHNFREKLRGNSV